MSVKLLKSAQSMKGKIVEGVVMRNARGGGQRLTIQFSDKSEIRMESSLARTRLGVLNFNEDQLREFANTRIKIQKQ